MPSFTNNKKYVPGHVLAKHSAPGLSALNVMSLMATSPNLRAAFKSRPSQRSVAMSRLPSNFAHRFYGGVVLPRVMRGPSGRFLGGHNTMKEHLNRYNNKHAKLARIETARRGIRALSNALPARVKARLNRLLNNMKK